MQLVSQTTGDVHVSRSQLAEVATPSATATWYPIPHQTVAATVLDTLEGRGYRIDRENWILAKRGLRVFGVIDLTVPITGQDSPGQGTTISLGVRSSFDKKLPLGIVAGSRVFVCSNLAFSGEISYKRRHTRNGFDDFRRQIDEAIDRLPAFRSMESARFDSWMNFELRPEQADALVLAMFEGGHIGMRMFRPVMDELRNPTFDDFSGRLTVWSLFNRITTALRKRADERALKHASETSRIMRILNQVIDSRNRVDTDTIVTPLAIEHSED